MITIYFTTEQATAMAEFLMALKDSDYGVRVKGFVGGWRVTF